MKKRIIYKKWIFEVDVKRTKEVYAKIDLGSPESCICSGCKNFSINREEIYPNEFKSLLNELGIDYKKESEVVHYCKLENGSHFYGGWFHFKGKILSGVDSRQELNLNDNSLSMISMTDDFKVAFSKDGALSFFDSDEFDELVQVDFSAHSEWIIDKNLELD